MTLNGKPVVIPSLIQRNLVGFLALRPGYAVPIAEIAELLWPQQQPPSWRNLIHVHVNRLRALIEPARDRRTPSRVLVALSASYKLDLAPEQLDVTRFDNTAAEAQRVAKTGDLPRAFQLYEQALECWRGPVLADSDDRLRRHPRTHTWNRRRVEVAMAFAELAFTCGKHARANRWLRELSDEDPLNERLHAQLMVALAGSGEQAAALQVFTRMRARLADQLGVDPGPQMREAQQLVLGWSAPARPDAVAGPARPRISPVPQQVPAAVPTFVGRDTELRWLDALADPGGSQPEAPPVGIISGTAGVGKTALAVRWAHQMRRLFPDGQLYLNLHGYDRGRPAMNPAEALRELLRSLGVSIQRIPAGLEARSALYRSILTDQRILVLLDNARDSDQVRPLLPSAPGAVVVVTSRDSLSGVVTAPGARTLALDLMTDAEAREMLSSWIGTPYAVAEPSAVDSVIAFTARLPLALAIVAARAAGDPATPLSVLAGELRDAGSRPDALAAGEPTTNIRTVFAWSYQMLSPQGARLFRTLGLYPGLEFGTTTAASLAGMPVAQVGPVLAELVRANLLTEHTSGRFTFHDLLRAYAADLGQTADDATRRHTTLEPIVEHYLQSAYPGDEMVERHRGPLPLAPP
ncbi:hypothetical protein I0C86_23230 [Plantactinospora sp. S1510]|uniref:OmpR/PhoB-type domain-containing protein n=1 Tax=Plantactinospora alkalitolerans TaxID=2789879 RepID=A0ABS0H068_9ACTN|nr:BTAD domain-containing putative transcriptional regulator [Plantactinospora alkalitolerans]MBF9131855.1 hypothetical protein [Plantactinospora alkalitolerans]